MKRMAQRDAGLAHSSAQQPFIGPVPAGPTAAILVDLQGRSQKSWRVGASHYVEEIAGLRAMRTCTCTHDRQ